MTIGYIIHVNNQAGAADMLTFKEISEYCKTIGYPVLSKRDSKGMCYVKVQEWTNDGRYFTKEIHTLCKMKLKAVTSQVYDRYLSIKYDMSMPVAEKVRALRNLGIECLDDGRHHIPEKYDFDITVEELAKAVDEGKKWKITRENNKMKRLLASI